MRVRINVQKTILAVIIINIAQIILIGGIVADNYIKKSKGVVVDFSSGSLALFIIIFFVIINSIIMIKNVFFSNIRGNENLALKNTIEQMESLNITLRAQRHDFMNHLQVVYGLIDMKEFKEASDYIEKVYSDIQKVNRVLKTSKPAINALLQAKSIYCEQKGIEMKINISTQLKDIKIPAWELCRVIGNILDNAVQAFDTTPGCKRVELTIYEDVKGYRFKIGNNGPKIPTDLQKKIFEPGFTTKGERGDGMGLSISMEKVTSFHGDIILSSDDQWTEFNIFFPN